MARAALFFAGTALGTATAAQADGISAARYDGLVDRYSHQVFASPANHGCLVVTLVSGREIAFDLPQTMVFEDRAPRLWDLTGDGQPEVVVVESSLSLGARLAVYDASGRIAATPFIGTSHRWLAPVGAADLDGDGWTEVAYVDRPHLAKILRVWRFRDGTLTEVTAASGLTNHRLGSDVIQGGIRSCAGTSPELITADAGWSRIVATRLVDGQLTARDLGPYGGPESLSAAIDDC